MYRATEDLNGIDHWYVVHCEPHKERQAASALADRLGLMIYLPEIKRRFRGRIQRALFFPCYLFVQTDLLKVTTSHINATPGVLRLVSFGGAPPSIPAAVIEALCRRIDALNDRGGLLEHGFQLGDTVRLKQGPLRGLEAVFVGPMKPSERVQILMEFMGQPREIEVPVDALERASPLGAPKQERRTRGKGRWIARR
jgi:transcriptional antiterminator RfaH